MKLLPFAAMVAFALIASGSPHNMLREKGQRSEGPDQDAEQQLIDLERQAYLEGLAGNTSAVLAAVSSDFMGWDSGIWDGKVHWVPPDKDAFANDLTSRKGTFASVSVDELQARVHGTTGVIRGRAVFKRKDGRLFETHFLDTWERRDHGWIQLAGATSTQQSQ